MKHKLKSMPALAALLITFGSIAGEANAAIVLSITELGDDLVITSSGSIDTSGFVFQNTNNTVDFFRPATQQLISRENPIPSSMFVSSAFSVSVPIFGSSSGTLGDGLFSNTTGAMSGLGFGPSSLYLPIGYLSGSSLSGTAIFVNQSFATMGLTSGLSFVGTLNNTAAETVTVTIGQVPETSQALLFGFGALGVMAHRRRKL